MPSARRLNSQFPWSTFCFEFFLFFFYYFFRCKTKLFNFVEFETVSGHWNTRPLWLQIMYSFFYVYFSLESLSLRSHFVKVYMNNLFPCIISLTTVNSTTCAYYTDFCFVLLSWLFTYHKCSVATKHSPDEWWKNRKLNVENFEKNKMLRASKRIENCVSQNVALWRISGQFFYPRDRDDNIDEWIYIVS